MKLIGLARLGRDAVVRQSGDQKVANLALAYNYGRKGEDGGRPTQWVDAALWGRQAEALAKYLLKGKQVECIVDDVHMESYEDRDGNRAYKLVGRVMSIELAGGGDRQGSDSESTPAPAPKAAPAAAPRPAPAPAPAAGAGRAAPF